MKITERVHAVKIPFTISLPQGMKIERFVYSYLIVGETIVAIDSGVAGSEEVICDYISGIGRKPEDVNKLVLTHAHPDHIGSACDLKKKTGCLVAAHNDARRWVEDTQVQYKERPVPGFNKLVSGPVNVDSSLEDGDIIDVGEDLGLRVIFTPGHSSGSISLFIEKEKVLISGDAVIPPGSLPIYEDHKKAVSSIERLKTEGEAEILLSSWTDPSQGDSVTALLEGSLEYLKDIDRIVLEQYGNGETVEPMLLCKSVIEHLGLPPFAVNPLISGSLMSHLKGVDQA